jgi:hypothetical protein
MRPVTIAAPMEIVMFQQDGWLPSRGRQSWLLACLKYILLPGKVLMESAGSWKGVVAVSTPFREHLAQHFSTTCGRNVLLEDVLKPG